MLKEKNNECGDAPLEEYLASNDQVDEEGSGLNEEETISEEKKKEKVLIKLYGDRFQNVLVDTANCFSPNETDFIKCYLKPTLLDDLKTFAVNQPVFKQLHKCMRSKFHECTSLLPTEKTPVVWPWVTEVISFLLLI